MRYELSDYEWSVIKPMLPNKPRGVPRVNDRRVFNGIFWVLRSGAPWRDLPESFGPCTTCYNRAEVFWPFEGWLAANQQSRHFLSQMTTATSPFPAALISDRQPVETFRQPFIPQTTRAGAAPPAGFLGAACFASRGSGLDA